MSRALHHQGARGCPAARRGKGRLEVQLTRGLMVMRAAELVDARSSDCEQPGQPAVPLA